MGVKEEEKKAGWEARVTEERTKRRRLIREIEKRETEKEVTLEARQWLTMMMKGAKRRRFE